MRSSTWPDPDGPRLGVVVNSGGLKGLVLDEVDALEIPLSTLGQTTVKAIAPLLTPDLKIENPLDCSGGKKCIGFRQFQP